MRSAWKCGVNPAVRNFRGQTFDDGSARSFCGAHPALRSLRAIPRALTSDFPGDSCKISLELESSSLTPRHWRSAVVASRSLPPGTMTNTSLRCRQLLARLFQLIEWFHAVSGSLVSKPTYATLHPHRLRRRPSWTSQETVSPSVFAQATAGISKLWNSSTHVTSTGHRNPTVLSVLTKRT